MDGANRVLYHSALKKWHECADGHEVRFMCVEAKHGVWRDSISKRGVGARGYGGRRWFRVAMNIVQELALNRRDMK